MLFLSNVAVANGKLDLHIRQPKFVTRLNAMTLKNAPVVKATNKLHISGYNIPILDYSHVNISYII